MKTPNDNSKLYAQAVEKLLTMFKSGEFPKAASFKIIQKKQGNYAKPSDKWSLGNQLLQRVQGTDDARGFKQWEEAGRHVLKGRKAIHILAPCTRKITETNEQGEDEEKLIIIGFRPLPVFRFEDTDGKPIEGTPDYTPPELPPLWNVAEKLGIKVSYAPMGGSYLGRFTSGKNTIELCAEDAQVYFHELSHAVHHEIVNLRTCGHKIAETVAEFSSIVLCELHGIHGYEKQGYYYIRQLIRKDDTPEAVLRLIMSVLNDVEKVVLRILEVASK